MFAPPPPIKAALCQFGSMSSAPPAALTARADEAPDHREQYWSLQSCQWEEPLEETSPHTVGVIRVHVRAGDVPPLDRGIDSATETLLAAGGHGQR